MSAANAYHGGVAMEGKKMNCIKCGGKVDYDRTIGGYHCLVCGNTETDKRCEFCSNHTKGDTLYEESSWDGGIGFDYIHNIKFCPLCGKELTE